MLRVYPLFFVFLRSAGFIGAIRLLTLPIRSGSAVNVARLRYPTPPTTALVAHFIFGKNLSLTVAFGVAVSGIYRVARTK